MSVSNRRRRLPLLERKFYASLSLISFLMILTGHRYNAMNHPLPFIKASNVLAPKKLAKEAPDLEEAIEEADDAEVLESPDAEEDDEIDLKKDKYIKQPKVKKPSKKAVKAQTADDGDSEEAKPKGRSKAKPAAAKGKAKK